MSIYLPRKRRVIYFPKCFLLHCGYPYFCAEEDDAVDGMGLGESAEIILEEDDDPFIHDLEEDIDCLKEYKLLLDERSDYG